MGEVSQDCRSAFGYRHPGGAVDYHPFATSWAGQHLGTAEWVVIVSDRSVTDSHCPQCPL